MSLPAPTPPKYIQRTHQARSLHMATEAAPNLAFTDCWNSQTLECYSSVFERTVWMALRCNQWACKPCARRKISLLARRVNDAKPNRLLTLTIDPSLWPDPRAAFDGTRRLVSELIRALRKQFGEIEYLRVTELTSRGWPHYHLLVRSPYIPHAVVKRLWNQLTGAIIVDLQPVRNKFQCYTYLVKYLSKMHRLEWTNRHVSFSKQFFPPTEPLEENPYGLKDKVIMEARPGKYLFAAYRNCIFIELAHGLWGLKRHDEPEPDQ